MHDVQTIVCNSGPLIALAGVKHLHILEKIYDRVLVPKAVYEEVTTSTALLGASEIQKAPWLISCKVSKSPDPLLLAELGKGEAEVIVLALEKKANKVLVDEKKARRIATFVYSLTVTGTVGILLKAKKFGYIEAVLPLINAMKNNGYYFSDTLVKSICLQANEQ